MVLTKHVNYRGTSADETVTYYLEHENNRRFKKYFTGITKKKAFLPEDIGENYFVASFKEGTPEKIFRAVIRHFKKSKSADFNSLVQQALNQLVEERGGLLRTTDFRLLIKRSPDGKGIVFHYTNEQKKVSPY